MFEQLRKQEPHQERGMETYSTVLFHLQKEVALSSLSQEMVNMDKLCPEVRSEEHTSELQSRPHISYAVFCLKKKKQTHTHTHAHASTRMRRIIQIA